MPGVAPGVAAASRLLRVCVCVLRTARLPACAAAQALLSGMHAIRQTLLSAMHATRTTCPPRTTCPRPPLAAVAAAVGALLRALVGRFNLAGAPNYHGCLTALANSFAYCDTNLTHAARVTHPPPLN